MTNALDDLISENEATIDDLSRKIVNVKSARGNALIDTPKAVAKLDAELAALQSRYNDCLTKRDVLRGRQQEAAEEKRKADAQMLREEATADLTQLREGAARGVDRAVDELLVAVGFLVNEREAYRVNYRDVFQTDFCDGLHSDPEWQTKLIYGLKKLHIRFVAYAGGEVEARSTVEACFPTNVEERKPFFRNKGSVNPLRPELNGPFLTSIVDKDLRRDDVDLRDGYRAVFASKDVWRLINPAGQIICAGHMSPGEVEAALDKLLAEKESKSTYNVVADLQRGREQENVLAGVDSEDA